jgi:hypothetical protein
MIDLLTSIGIVWTLGGVVGVAILLAIGCWWLSEAHPRLAGFLATVLGILLLVVTLGILGGGRGGQR